MRIHDLFPLNESVSDTSDQLLHADPAQVAQYAAEWDKESGDAAQPPDAASIGTAQATLRRMIGPDGTLTLFSAQRLGGVAIRDLAPGSSLGRIWTTQDEFSHAHNFLGIGGSPYRFTVSVPADQVDWLATLVLYSNGEPQVRLKDGARVRLMNIQPMHGGHDGKTVRIDLIGKLFRSH